MPERIHVLTHFIEVVFLTALNLFFVITWVSVITVIPLLFSTIYSIGRIKRDVDKYHNGSLKEYTKYLFGKAKKN